MAGNSRFFLIADSGSTKTDWRLISAQNKILPFATIGFNPFFTTSEKIFSELRKNLIPSLPSSVIHQPLSIYFYGAGCSSRGRCSIIRTALKKCFPAARIAVNHDLLGAARALFGNIPGIAVILGTGSNSCLYDGKNIIDNIPALGYVLGDEGSGAHMGKLFLRSYLYREMPVNLGKHFEKDTGFNKEKILTSIYNRPLPNRFLASFSKFIYRYRQDRFIRKLVYYSFDEFITHHIFKYRNYRKLPFGIVGSIGYHFSNILKTAAAKNKLHLTSIIESPVDELVRFHLGKK